MQRRKFLRTASAITIGIAGLAGCGSPGPGVEDGEGTPAGEGTDAVGTEPAAGTEAPAGTTAPGAESPAGTMVAGTETPAGMTAAGGADIEGMVGEVPQGLQVTNTQLTESAEGARVTGVIENTGDQAFEEVEVQVTLLDDNDEIIGQFFHNTEEAEASSLEAGQQWEFSVDLQEAELANVTRYRVDVDGDIDQNVDIDLGVGTETTTPG